VKLVVAEPESSALQCYLADSPPLATSRIALVEVIRAVSLANPAREVRLEAERLIESCILIEVSDALLRDAADLASAPVRTLDAIHLASALRIQAAEIIAYDRRLMGAATARGLSTTSPGTEGRSRS
jgi:predicted nucleic acid-binding protein